MRLFESNYYQEDYHFVVYFWTNFIQKFLGKVALGNGVNRIVEK